MPPSRGCRRDTWPAALGQAATQTGPAGDESYALVSFLTSPMPISSMNDYVVFVSTGEVVDRYDWTFTYVGTDLSHTTSTAIGTTSFMPALIDLLQVTVELTLAGGGTVTISMFQEVRPRFTGFEFFFDAAPVPAVVVDQPTVAALGGDPRASEELANDLRTYVLAAAAGTGLPPRLLAAFAYHGSMQAPKLDRVGPLVWSPGRDQKLEWVASELNGDRWNLATDIDDRLGVCQLLLAVAAMTVGPNGTAGDTYTPWRERAADGSDASTVDEAITTAFDQLALESRIDLFNLARFPRTNIELCAALLVRLRDRPNRWPGATADELIAQAAAPVTLATEYDTGADDGAPPTDARAAGETVPSGVGTSISGYLHLVAVTILFADSLQEGADSYGGYSLQRDDDDAQRRWGGAAAVDAANPPPGSHVRQLQDDLSELGFALVADVRPVADARHDAAGVFGPNTEWAVRELQVYATMRYLAIETAPAEPRYVARLEQALNLYHYAGPLSGVVNVNTRIVIDLWKRRSWRCPVVIEAWDTDLGTIGPNTVPSWTVPSAGFGNLWRHDDATAAPENQADSRLMFARDFTGHYQFEPLREPDLGDPDDLMDVGCYFPGPGGPLTRPGGRYWQRAAYPSVWPECEILPDTLVGVGMAGLNPAQLTTFRVVRAVSEVECLGFFDSVNCYDTAFVSVGPAHWTLGLSRPAMAEGELCGYLAYLSAFDRAAFFDAFERFGMRIDTDWINANGDRSGRDLLDPAGQRKYTAWIALQGEDGQYARRFFNVDDGNFFRTWHWAYRFIMAGRAIPAFRRRMWDMARIRLRDVRSAPIPAAAGVPDVPDGAGGTRTATIGDCFTSEKAMGMLHRWHIYRPVDICTNNTAGQRVVAAIAAAGLPGVAGDPTTWTTVHEQDLIDALRAEVPNINARQSVKNDLATALDKVMSWPVYVGRPIGYQLPNMAALSDVRRSFQANFDQSGLPPAPV